MKLRPRLALSHGVIILWMAIFFPLALFVIQRLADRVDTLESYDLRALDVIERMRQELGTEVVQFLQSSLQPLTDAAPADTRTQASVHRAIDAARPYFAQPDEREALDEFERRYVHFENALVIWRAGQMAQAGAVQLPADFDDMQRALHRLRELKAAESGESAGATREFAHRALVGLALIGLLALLAGLLATLRLVRSITGPVDQLNGLVRRMSEGDFEIVYQDASIDEFNVLGRHFETVGGALRLFRATNLERLVVEQRRIEAVLDSIGDGLVIFSEQGRIERINAIAERQLGLEAGLAVGKNFEDIGDRGIGLRVREVLATGEFADAGAPEIRIERDGETRVLAYWLTRFVESESGRPGVVLVMRDVTTQREFDKMRSDFVLRAAHELRTPITSIRMGLGLLGEKMRFPAGSRDAELYETVEHELARIVALLADLLDLSRLRVGGHIMERAPTEIDSILTEAQQRFSLAAADADVRLAVELETGLPRLPLCRSAFDRVLDNLVANALRHTPAGGAITLSACRASERIAIAVTDTGQGIAYAQQALIFQPFVQIGSKRGGAGLGLAICKEIVHQHGGEIRVSSMPRRGTTFTILLAE